MDAAVRLLVAPLGSMQMQAPGAQDPKPFYGGSSCVRYNKAFFYPCV